MQIPTADELTELDVQHDSKPRVMRIPDFGCVRYNTNKLKMFTTFVWGSAAVIE